MKKYTIVSPYIGGVLSDDHLYFEGVSRPSEMYTIRDQGIVTSDSVEVLEKYLNDIYNLFLRKLSVFTITEHVDDELALKMQALLQEIIKVKRLIEGVEDATVDSD